MESLWRGGWEAVGRGGGRGVMVMVVVVVADLTEASRDAR